MFDVSAPLFADGGDDAGLLAAILDNALLPPPADAGAAADSVSALVKQMAVEGSIPPPPPPRPLLAGGSAASRPPAAAPLRSALGQVMDESAPMTELGRGIGGLVSGASAALGAASPASLTGAADAGGRRETPIPAGGTLSVGDRSLPGAVPKKGRKRKEKMGELDDPPGVTPADGSCAEAADAVGEDVSMGDADPPGGVADAKLLPPPSATAGRPVRVASVPAGRLASTAAVVSGLVGGAREQGSHDTGAAAPVAGAGSTNGATAEVDKTRRAFMCTTCGKHFRRAHNRKVHARVHTNETPYRCAFAGCDRQFRWKSSLVSHRRWHADVTAGGGVDCNSSVGGGTDNQPGALGSPVSPPASVALGMAALVAAGGHAGPSPLTGAGGPIALGSGNGVRVATSGSVVFRAAPKVVSGVLNPSSSAPVLLSVKGAAPAVRTLPCGEEGPSVSPRAPSSTLPIEGRTTAAANDVPLSAVTGSSPRRGVPAVPADDPTSSLAWLDFLRPDTARKAPPSGGATERSPPSRGRMNVPASSMVTGAGAAVSAFPTDPSQGRAEEAVRGRAATDRPTVCSVGGAGSGPVGAGLASMYDRWGAGQPFPAGVGSHVGGGSLRGSPVWSGSDPVSCGYGFDLAGGYGGADGNVEVPASYPPALTASSFFPLSAPPPLLTVPGPGLTTSGMGFLDGPSGVPPPMPSCIKAGSPEPMPYPAGGGTCSFPEGRLAHDFDSAAGGPVTPVGDFSSSAAVAAASAAVDSFMLLSPSTMDVRLVTPDSLCMLPLAPSPLSLSSMSVSPGETRDLFPPNVVADLNGQSHFF